MASAPITDEKDLLIKLRDGDEAAFEILYNHYKKPITAKLIRLLKSEELAADVLQDLFLKIWEIKATINPEKSFRAYLYTIAGNMVRAVYRKALRDDALMIQIVAESEEAYLYIEEDLIARETVEHVQEALKQLPQRQREVFSLHKIEGKSYKEIAEILHINAATINSHIYRAGLQLTKILKESTWIPHIFWFICISSLVEMLTGY